MFNFSNKNDFTVTILTSSSNSKAKETSTTLDLISCGYHEIPCTFKISANNLTYSFNADILRSISPTIRAKLQSNPDLTEFRIWVSDSTNVMQKFEDLLRLFPIEISQTELPILQQIFTSLEIAFPRFDNSKSAIYRFEFTKKVAFRCDNPSRNTFSFANSRSNIYFGGKPLKITSNGKVYECCLNGACSSNIIKKIIESDPTCDTFQYNLNENEDFSLIQQFFNFESISINTHNMDFLKKVCKELQIDCLIEKVEQFIQSFSNQLLLAESNDHLVEPISDLFESLYSIATEGSEQVCHHILETEWIQDESNILEMISCILQVIRTNLRLHSYILELIVLLNKELNNSNESNQFLPIFTKRLLSESNKSLISCAFLYKLQERQIITFKEITEFFQNTLLLNSYPETIQLIFQPELKEHGIDFKLNLNNPNNQLDLQPKRIEHVSDFTPNPTFINNSKLNFTFDFSRENNSNNKKNFRLSIDSSQYPEMRKNFEPLNEILRLIIQDDYEKLQIKISQENIDINQSVQVISLINSTDEDSYVSLINYAAEYGSINCFKYLFVNHAEQSSNLLIHAVKGGNPEIIQISHSAMKKLIPDLTTEPSNTSFSFNSQKKCMSQFDVYLDSLIVAIRMHRYSIIDWILTQIRDINAIKDLHSHLDKLFDACTQNGNAQALITLMNYDINVPEFLKNIKDSRDQRSYFSFGLGLSSQSLNNSKSPTTTFCFSSLIQQGFYHFIQFLFQLTNQKQIDYLCFNDPSLVVRSQNIKILHLFTNLPVDQLLYLSIKSDYFSLVDNIMKDFHYCCESTDYYNIYLSSVTNKSVPMFKLITSKYPLEQSKQYIESSQYLDILCKACESCNYEAVLAFTDILLSIDKNTYFTSPFHKALSAFSSPICKFFIEKNVNLDLIDISKNTKIIQLDNGKFAPLLFEKADKSIQLQLFYFLLYQFITSLLNEHHKEYIAKLLALNKSDQINSMLNEISPNSPFVFSIIQGNFYVFDTFIDYFGDQISDHIDQINFALKYLSETSLPHNSFAKIYSKLTEFANAGLNVTCENDTFLTLAVKQSNIELLQLCLANMKDQQIFDEMSIRNPFVYAIKAHNLTIFNAFVDYFGDNISKQTSQINYGLTLLLEDYYNDNTKQDSNDSREQSSKQNSRNNYYHSDSFILLMRRLLEFINFTTQITYRNDTFLSLAVKKSNLKLLQLCLENLKNQQIFDEMSIRNPFVYAIKTHNLDIFNAFIDFFGENISKQTSQINYGLALLLEDYYDTSDNTTNNQSFYYNHSDSFILLMRRLLEFINFTTQITYRNDTFLSLAVKKSSVKLLQLCLENLKDQQIFDEISIENPFVYAIKAHNLNIVNVFIDFFGDNISKQTSQINLGLTLLLEDYYNDNKNNDSDNSRNNYYHSNHFILLVKRLLEFTNFATQITYRNDTFLTLAVKNSNIELLQLCLENLKDQQIFDEMSIENPFVFAIKKHNLGIVNTFIDYFGDNISKQTSQINYGLSLLLEDYYNRNTRTPIGCLSNGDYYHSDDFILLLKRLLEFTNCGTQIAYRNDTFLTLAVKASNVKLLQFCLENLKNQQLFDDISIENPFIYAIKQHNLGIVNAFLDYFGDNISKQISQINYGLTLLLEKLYDDSHDNKYFSPSVSTVAKRLFEVTNFKLVIDYDTFLTLAVKQSNIELLQLCLENIKDQQIFDEMSIKNPFIYAIKTHNLDIVNAFIDYFGDNISKRTSQINYGLTLLLEDSAPGERKQSSYDAGLAKQCNRILNFLVQFFFIVPNFDHDILFKLYNLDEDSNSFLFLQKYMDCRETKTGNTLLMAAILRHKLEIAILLAQCEGVDYKARNYNNQTALTLALDQMEKENPKNQCSLSNNQQDNSIEEQYSQLIRLLIKTIDRDEIDRVFYFCNDVLAQELILHKDLNINYIHITPHDTNSKSKTNTNSADENSGYRFSISPLHYSTSLLHSIEKNYNIKSELIISHPQFNPQLSNANEAVFSVITNKNFQIFNRLLDFVDINILNSKGESLLLHCCTNNFKEGVHRILNDSKFDPVKVHFDTILLTVLQGYTNSYFQFDIMNLLVDYDSKHSQILHFDQLLPNGKSFFTQIKIPKDDDPRNRTSFGISVPGPSQTKDEIENIRQYINFFLNKGADPNKPDRFGVYPLQHAIQIKSLSFVQALHYSGKIDYSIKINTSSIKNGTYLHLAAFSSEEITKQLIASKAFDLEFKDDLGHTPYMIADNEMKNLSFKLEKLSTNKTLCNNLDKKRQNLRSICSLLQNKGQQGLSFF